MAYHEYIYSTNCVRNTVHKLEITKLCQVETLRLYTTNKFDINKIIIDTDNTFFNGI